MKPISYNNTKTSIKSIAKEWLPPILTKALQSLEKDKISFEGPFSSWEKASAQSTGYDATHILDKVLAATLKVRAGEAAFERDSVLFDTPKYEWAMISGLMWAAAKNNGKLNVLDFGGALGSSYFQNKKFWDTLPELQWNIVEQPNYVSLGKTHIQNEQIRFYNTIESYKKENTPNVILVSSVLQYLPDPFTTISELIALKSPFIVLDRITVNATQNHAYYVQHVPQTIYKASYPCISFSEELLIQAFKNYNLVTEFQSLPFPALTKINTFFKGYIYSAVKCPDQEK